MNHTMRISELVFPPSGFICDHLLFGCCTISGLPLCPCALPDIKLLPILFVAGELLLYEHGIGSNDDERHISYGVVGPLSFGLSVLECVDVLVDSLAFEMVTVNLFFSVRKSRASIPPLFNWRWVISFSTVTKV